MLTPETMLSLAAELTDAAAAGDAVLLAAIAWRLYGEAAAPAFQGPVPAQ